MFLGIPRFLPKMTSTPSSLDLAPSIANALVAFRSVAFFPAGHVVRGTASSPTVPMLRRSGSVSMYTCSPSMTLRTCCQFRAAAGRNTRTSIIRSIVISLATIVDIVAIPSTIIRVIHVIRSRRTSHRRMSHQHTFRLPHHHPCVETSAFEGTDAPRSTVRISCAPSHHALDFGIMPAFPSRRFQSHHLYCQRPPPRHCLPRATQFALGMPGRTS